ncbi:37S ribosomal protein S16, mitochondrial [Neocucurbitaria cava]|uniref:37S ribosomal protein S16, mitochondrial n=1 Tax=Neocucurbitaria cava TaxID=798079 RepID=A0A9W9CPH3_9PLEO|nr:37S ribosomal protein S16, mitochondrial [Neocucurbitaria cava]
MVLRIRLARFGKKHSPFYNIVVAHARTARNSRPLEVLGTYDPKPQPPRPGDTHGRPWKDIKLDISRARYWVGVGAQPSDTAWRLLSMVGILEPQYRISQIQGQVVKADSAAKSLIPERSAAPAAEVATEAAEEVKA